MLVHAFNNQQTSITSKPANRLLLLSRDELALEREILWRERRNLHTGGAAETLRKIGIMARAPRKEKAVTEEDDWHDPPLARHIHSSKEYREQERDCGKKSQQVSEYFKCEEVDGMWHRA